MARSEKGLGKRGKTWQTYEEVARYVIQQIRERFHLAKVEGKQSVLGQKSGTWWAIDAKGVRDGDGAIIVVECRRRKSRQSQEDIGAVAYRIMDTNAAGGIIVSPLPLQKGAKLVAAANKIEHMQLDPHSTLDTWTAQIRNMFYMGLTMRAAASVAFEATVYDAQGNVVLPMPVR
jgi:hypothetical protein